MNCLIATALQYRSEVKFNKSVVASDMAPNAADSSSLEAALCFTEPREQK